MKLIDKSALLAEIDRLFDKHSSKHDIDEAGVVLLQLREDVESLKVKEVDLNNEYVEEVYSHIDSIKDTADRMTSGNFMHNKAAIKFSANTIARVLELMGLKAQKGE